MSNIESTIVKIADALRAYDVIPTNVIRQILPEAAERNGKTVSDVRCNVQAANLLNRALHYADRSDGFQPVTGGIADGHAIQTRETETGRVSVVPFVVNATTLPKSVAAIMSAEDRLGDLASLMAEIDSTGDAE